MKLFTKKKVALGDGHVTQYTILESKRFGGIWLYHWETVDQMRFHTHAFNSICFLLRGSYTEEVLDRDGAVTLRTVDQWMRPRYLPMGYCHRILEAKGSTWSIVFFGGWAKSWQEYFPSTDTWVRYGWGRVVLSKITGLGNKRS